MLHLLHNGSLPLWLARWTPILLDAALKGLAVLALAALATLFMRRSAAALRHLVWLMAVIALLCLPALSVLVPGWNVLPKWFESSSLDVQALSTSSSTAASTTAVSRRNDSPATARPDDSRQPVVATTVQAGAPAFPMAHAQELLVNSDNLPEDATSVLNTSQLVAICVLMTWAAGALVFFALTVLGLLSLGRLKKRSRFVTEKSWCSQVEQLSRDLGLRRPVDILLSTQQLMPMVWGLFRIKVLLPTGATDWDSNRRRFVLLHELAHARRWDYLTHLLTRLACALHWFNPLIWIAAQCMAVERERACDDLVLNSGSEPMDYAEELLNVVAGLRRPTSLGAAAIAMAQPSKLESRLKAILDITTSRRRLTRTCMGACLLATVCLVLPLASLRPAATAEDNTETAEVVKDRLDSLPINGDTSVGTVTEPREAQVRMLHFPQDRSLGVLYTRDSELRDRRSRQGWEELGQARGEISVLPGKELRLAVSDHNYEHLAGLASLGANDIQDLSISCRNLKDSDLLHLKGLAGLQSLRLSSGSSTYTCPLTGEGLACLQGMRSLRNLGIMFTMISDESLIHFKYLTNLENLNLWNDKGISGDGLAHLRNLSSLRSISFHQVPIEDFGLNNLKEMDQLEALGLQYTHVTDKGLAHLKGLAGLKWLVLPPDTTDVGLAELQGLASLEELSISDTKVTDDGLVHLKGLTGLKSLGVSGRNMTGRGLKYLRNMPRLTEITVSMGMMDDEGMRGLKGLTAVTSLYLGRTQISDAGLINARGLTALEYLNLKNTRITDTGLASLKGLTVLRVLDLEGTDITDAGLANLQGLSSLRTLWLQGTDITDVGLVHLKGLQSMETLYLDHTQLSDAGLVSLREMRSLQYLVLSGTKVSGEGLVHLKDLKSLRHLYVRVDSVSEAGLRHLQEMAWLHELGLGEGSINETALADLKKALPDCRISMSPVPSRPRRPRPTPLSLSGNQQVERSTVQSRVLHFPRDRSLGMVMIADRNYLDTTSYDDWEALGEATGDLVVPQGMAVRLDVSREACADLSPLSALAPNDLHMIFCRRPEFTDDALSHMSHLTGLQELYLRDTGLLGTGLKHLAKLRSLKRLRVDGTHVGDKELAFLADLPALEMLNLTQTPINDTGMKHVGKITSLRELILGQGVGDEGLSYLKDLVGLRYLLPLSQAITDAGLAHVAGMTQMETLWLDGAQVSDAGLVHLKGMMSIKTLCLYGTQVTEQGLGHLSGLQTLEDLLLSFSVTDTGLQHLAQMRALKQIGIDGDSVTASGLHALSKMKGLEHIGIESEKDPEAIIGQLAVLPGLTKLGLPRYTTDKTMAQLKKLPVLQELSLNSEQITSRGMATLTQLPSLQSLSLMDMKLSLEDWGTLGRISSLQRLDIDLRSKITDAHLKHLTRLQSLKYLSVDCSSQDMHVTDEGLTHIAKLRSLERLTLHGAKITDQGLQQLQGLSSLKWMDLQRCKVTDQGLERLKRKLPALKWYL
jgi:beta-lactamase regulating signal transducer with metallopeptidase domain/Leucine-rich repeat (LRR) protein